MLDKMAEKCGVSKRAVRFIYHISMNENGTDLESKINFVKFSIRNFSLNTPIFNEYEIFLTAIRYNIPPIIARIVLIYEKEHTDSMTQGERMIFMAKIFKVLDKLITFWLPLLSFSNVIHFVVF